jgi:cell surface protein SprA
LQANLERIASKILIALLSLFFSVSVFGQNNNDSTNLKYPIQKRSLNPYDKSKPSSNINLKDPEFMQSEVEYDPETNQYILKKKAGSFQYSAPYSMSFDEYQNYDIKGAMRNYWKDRYQSESFEHQSSLIPKINVGGQAFETIFGSSTIDIRPRGSASLKFGLKITKTENPDIPVNLQTNTTFDFDEQIQMDVTGKVGDNLEMKLSYNTESQFDFDNKMNIRYQGKEDDILQKIEAGNVSMPLSTSLISGSQSLFGVLTEMKFGKLYLTTLFSQQEGETKTINVEGGAQKNEFEVEAVDYDKNRHFLFSHYFRRHYDQSLKNLPVVPSAVNIRKVEVWVTQKQYDTENTRSIIALLDLGEEKDTSMLYGHVEKATYTKDLQFNSTNGLPDNNANSLYQEIANLPGIRNIYTATSALNGLNYEGGKHYEKLESAVLLESSKYSINTKLGYISLSQSLNADEVLGIAFEYTINGGDSTVYKVGEFASEVDSGGVVMVKMLKGTNLSPNLPNWNLMMKNIYSMGAYQVNSEDFIMEVEYYHDETGTTVFNFPDSKFGELKNQKLLNIMQLDNMDVQGNAMPGGDGVFDFVDNYTIQKSNGRIIFPVLEPFGGHLENKILTIDGVSSSDKKFLAKEYTFPELYDSTQYKAEQITAKNKYWLTGSYKSSAGSEIYLNSFNIPEGSVKVTAGGTPLVENQDFTVDYNMGRVKILNEGLLASGTPIKISLESNSLISLKSKTLIGTNAEYRFSDDFNLGATFMNLTERPQTAKVNQGDEPISNSIIGLNGSYRTEAPFLTKAVDLLPFIETKEKSSITFEGEFAHLMPGHNKAIEQTAGAESAYIEDFEGSESSILLSTRVGWQLASVPQIFDETRLFDSLAYGYNRAKLAWYQIDNTFYGNSSTVSDKKLSNLWSYRVKERDIYPNKETKGGIPTDILTFDLAYYPEERGPYNYEPVDGQPGVSLGLNEDGTLKAPQTRWAGIMKSLSQPDFESQNIEYIEFWLMDPFVESAEDSKGGELFFNLGSVSEDILKDSRKSYEQGLPTTIEDVAFTDQTNWSRVPTRPVLSSGFDPLPGNRKYQDVGLDGLSSNGSLAGDDVNEEAIQFSRFLDGLKGKISTDAFAKISKDPSSDDYHHYRGTDYDNLELDVIERYKNYNNHEGNSPSGEQQEESFSTVGTRIPDMEDINQDNTLSETEAYYQYRVSLRKEDMVVGSNYITDIQESSALMEDESEKQVKWYQFRIPVDQPDNVIGGIEDFRSIRFVRMFVAGWDKQVVLRFAKLELVRAEWRRYKYALQESDEHLSAGEDLSNTPFSVGSVNIEENKGRDPINYVLPPEVSRQLDNYSGQAYQQNEQSMSMRVDSLEDGFAKAVYKNINMDMRDYGMLRMFAHAESLNGPNELDDKDLTCFIRLGSDFTNNYYEYEVPLAVTPWGSYGESESQQKMVWPESNNLDIEFDKLIQAKKDRNNDATASSIQRYSVNDGVNRITVKGNPSLAMVKTIMIGVRNPNQRYNKFSNSDDGQPKSAIIWVNELRLTDFDESGGWAATGRINARLADFGSVSLSGSTTQPGFGGIEQKGPERAKEESNQVDISSNFELGKFFPKDSKIRIPMYLGYSRRSITPEYNPLDQDILLEDALSDKNTSSEEKDILKSKVIDLTERRSINFTNVGVGASGKGKPKFYSPSNLSATYVYNEMKHHDVGTEFNNTYNQNASINYVYNTRPKNIKPLSKVKLFRKMALLKDFNFFYMPSQVSYRTGIDTRFNESLLRNLNNPAQKYKPYYNNQFTWSRKFDIKYNLSRGLKMSFSFNKKARRERQMANSLFVEIDSYDSFKEEVKNTIMSGGEAMNYSQQFTANYTIPINKIKLLNWMSATASYGGTYDWKRGPDILKEDLDPKNTINNSQKAMLRGQMNLNRLYTKVDYLKDLDRKYKKSAKNRNKPKIIDVEYTKDRVRFKGVEPKRISHNLKTEDEIKIEVTTEEGKKVDADFDIIDKNKIEIILKQPSDEKLAVKVSGKKEKFPSPFQLAAEYTILALTGVKQVSADVNQNRAMAVYGFNGPNADNIYGILSDKNMFLYSFGNQFGAFNEHGESFIKTLLESDDLLVDQTLIQPYAVRDQKTWNFKATYEPIKSLRLDFSGKYAESETYSAYYNYDKITQVLVNESPEAAGSFSMNIWMLNTAFNKIPSADDYKTSFFEDYQKNYQTIAERHAKGRSRQFGNYDPSVQENGLPQGYNYKMSEIAIPAFLATFGSSNSKSSPLNFKSWVNFRPSWRFKYDGLAKTERLKKYLRNITFSHGYTNTLNVGNFKSNTRFFSGETRILDDVYYTNVLNDLDSTFVSKYDLNSFTASEQFLPMVGIDMTWKKGIISKFEYKRTRSMTMSLTNNQLTEMYTWEFVIGSGYRIDDVKLRFKKLDAKSNLNLRADLSIRDNVTVSRNIDQLQENITAGQKVFSLKFTADYQLSQKLQAQLYFNNQINTPKMSTSFRTSNTEFGFSLRFSLTQ